MDLSFITINHYNSRALQTCLQSIEDSAGKLSHEIIVVDNSAGDPDFIDLKKKFPRARYIANPQNVGFAVANNQGARKARGETLLFINPDAVLHEGAAERLLAFCKTHPDAGIAGPKVLNADGSLQYSCRNFPTLWSGLFNRYSLLTRLFPNNRFSADYLMLDFDHDSVKEVDWVSGCCMMIRKEVFRQIGGFDENYFLFNEDVDICRAAWNNGFKVVYCPTAQINHDISSSNSKTPARIVIQRHRGMSYYYKKHHSANVLKRFFVNAMVGLRCCSQLILNVFK